jgi:hypothetical protein
MMEPIKRQQFRDPDRMAVQDAVIEAVQADPEVFIERYGNLRQAYGGRYINSDLFKETFEPYRQSRESRNRYNVPVHNAAAVLASEQLRRVLQLAPDLGRDKVVLLTGLPGAGKTFSVLEQDRFPADVHAVYEGQLSNPVTALDKVQAVLDAGFKPTILVVHPLPERALDNTLNRFAEQGRGASIHVLAKIMGELPSGLEAVHAWFGDQVRLEVMDRRDDYVNPVKLEGWQQLSILRSEGDYEYIRERLERHLEVRRDGISEAAWRQAAGLAPAGIGQGQPDRMVIREREALAQSRTPESGQGTVVLTVTVPQEIADRLGVQAALAHLNTVPGGLQALHDAGRGQSLDAAQREALRGWNVALFDAATDRFTRAGELSYMGYTHEIAAAQRQSPELTPRERESLQQQEQQRQQQMQLQARNIAEREEARDKAEKVARQVERLKDVAAGIEVSDVPGQVKQQAIEQVREQAREIVRETPREVRGKIPKRDRGPER